MVNPKDQHPNNDLQTLKRIVRLSELSRRVVNAAEQVAVANQHHTVSVSHVLFVLANERRSPVSAMLRECGIDVARLERSLKSAEADSLLSIEAFLVQAAHHAQHEGSHYTGTEHLLLTLFDDENSLNLMRDLDIDTDALLVRLDAHLNAR